MKRTPLARRTPLRASRRTPDYDSAAWREGLGPCVVCTTRQLSIHVDGHHVIPKSVLIRRGFRAFVTDKRNRLALCRTHHANHHSRSQPIPRELLPVEAFRFADELGLGWYLDRHYPVAMAA